MIEKYCETQWLSLQNVLVKIMEQWENLSEYVLKKVPTLAGFNGTKCFVYFNVCSYQRLPLE